MRMTKQRKTIIDFFQANAEKALNVEMIYEQLQSKEMNVSTVYRTVEKLLEMGMIHRTVIDSVAYYYLTKQGHKHFMVCTNCKKLIPINCFIQKILPSIAGEQDFFVTGHDITIFGLCSACQQLLGLPNQSEHIHA